MSEIWRDVHGADIFTASANLDALQVNVDIGEISPDGYAVVFLHPWKDILNGSFSMPSVLLIRMFGF